MKDIWRMVALAALLSAVGCITVDQQRVTGMPYPDLLKLASIYIQEGNNPNAEMVLEDAVKSEPDRPEAYAMLGDIFYSKDDLPEAALYYLKALERNGEDTVVLNNLAWVEMGQENYSSALAYIERAVEMAPQPLYPYLDTRARIFRAMGDLDKALSSARIALSLTPEHEVEMRADLIKLIRSIENGVEEDVLY
ncbi:MAG: tetratricopeptide repeat protein [bacterium]|nr:MAG: tetratricopeptide repeat protein [bacterium]